MFALVLALLQASERATAISELILPGDFVIKKP